MDKQHSASPASKFNKPFHYKAFLTNYLHVLIFKINIVILGLESRFIFFCNSIYYTHQKNIK